MSELQHQIQAKVDYPVVGMVRLQGGMISSVYRIDLANGDRLVAKHDSKANATLDIEAFMLRYLREHSTFPVPEVIYSDPNLLLISFIDGQSNISPAVQSHAAELLIALHSHDAPQFGLEQDTLIGPLHQPNPQYDSWIAFFRDQRLLYMAREALKEGALQSNIFRRLDKLADRLPERLTEPANPSLIHGDLWTTNILAKNGQVTGFIDPAIYYADREIELAYTTLFGTFDESFFARYTEHHTLDHDFFETRRHIYNLYPLLVHVRLFGGHYQMAVSNTLQRLGF